jgi:hypothetical protein
MPGAARPPKRSGAGQGVSHSHGSQARVTVVRPGPRNLVRREPQRLDPAAPAGELQRRARAAGTQPGTDGIRPGASRRGSARHVSGSARRESRRLRSVAPAVQGRTVGWQPAELTPVVAPRASAPVASRQVKPQPTGWGLPRRTAAGRDDDAGGLVSRQRGPCRRTVRGAGRPGGPRQTAAVRTPNRRGSHSGDDVAGLRQRSLHGIPARLAWWPDLATLSSDSTLTVAQSLRHVYALRPGVHDVDCRISFRSAM